VASPKVPALPPDDKDTDDLGYFKLVSLAIAGTLAVYWGLQYLQQSLMEYLVGTVVAAAFAAVVAVAGLRHQFGRRLPAGRERHPVEQRYRALLDEVAGFTVRKRELLEAGLVPQLRELIEEKLPELLARRDRYRDYWQRCFPERLQGEIDELEARATAESDPDIRRAVVRNLDIARSTLANMAAIEKTLKLYELQISSIDKHLENLDTKLHILDFDDDIKAAAESIVQGINCDIDDLEKALVQMDALRVEEERHA